MTIELVDLATMTAELRPPLVLSGTPAGDRMIFEVESGRLEGGRIRATLKGQAAADWLTVGPDGTGALDVRALVETDDGALVFIQYNGRVDASRRGAALVYSAPRFETGDDRYRWLNRVQAVGKGTFDGRTLRYELYEVR
jgi:Protein of unknown function (DUF3237)